MCQKIIGLVARPDVLGRVCQHVGRDPDKSRGYRGWSGRRGSSGRWAWLPYWGERWRHRWCRRGAATGRRWLLDGRHVANRKKEFARQEDYLDALVASAQGVNEKTDALRQEMVQLETETVQLIEPI